MNFAKGCGESHAKDATKSYYEAHADAYFRATYSADLQPLWDKLTTKLRRGDCILDLGCGSGRDLRYFSQHGFRAVGIDYSLRLVELARAYAEQPVILGDFASLPFEDKSFDAAWSIGSLVHVPRESISSVLSEVHRILKDGAFILTSVKKGKGEEVDDLGRYNVFYSADEWASVQVRNGYEVVEVEETVETRTTKPGNVKRIVWIVGLARSVNSSSVPFSIPEGSGYRPTLKEDDAHDYSS